MAGRDALLPERLDTGWEVCFTLSHIQLWERSLSTLSHIQLWERVG